MADLRALLPARLDDKGETALSILGSSTTPYQREAVRKLLVRARQAGRAEERAARARRRRERKTEDADYARAQVRMLTAMARRGAGDLPALLALADLAEQLPELQRLAVAGLRAQGHSWADIGRTLGISRQGAHKQYRRKPEVDSLGANDG